MAGAMLGRTPDEESVLSLVMCIYTVVGYGQSSLLNTYFAWSFGGECLAMIRIIALLFDGQVGYQ